jgi:hypothetical protein
MCQQTCPPCHPSANCAPIPGLIPVGACVSRFRLSLDFTKTRIGDANSLLFQVRRQMPDLLRLERPRTTQPPPIASPIRWRRRRHDSVGLDRSDFWTEPYRAVWMRR